MCADISYNSSRANNSEASNLNNRKTAVLEYGRSGGVGYRTTKHTMNPNANLRNKRTSNPFQIQKKKNVEPDLITVPINDSPSLVPSKITRSIHPLIKDSAIKGVNSSLPKFQKPNLRSTVLYKENLRATLIDLKPIDNIGRLKLAKIHQSANRPLHKIKDLDERVEFCQCCTLPCEYKGIIEKYNYCDSTELYYDCGVGTVLYYYFFKFSMLIVGILFVMIGISYMIGNYQYYAELRDLCNLYYNSYSYVPEVIQRCKKYLNDKDT